MHTADEELREAIRAAGLRATRSRVVVLELLRGRTAPTSHTEVAELLEDAGWDRVTLYRNLTDLTSAGLLRRVDLGDHIWRFEPTSHPQHGELHPHFLCTSCGEVACLPVITVDPAGLPRSFAAGQVEVQLRGLCDECF